MEPTDLIRLAERAVANLIKTSRSATEISQIVSRNYQLRRLEDELGEYDAPLDPFKILSVPPGRITTFTGRAYPPWRNFKTRFGTVEPGEWDLTRPAPVDDVRGATPPSLYIGETFSDSVVHQSLVNHFVHDTPWRETRIVQEAVRLVDTRDIVWNCTSTEEIREKCEQLDQIYDEIRQERDVSEMRAVAGTPISILNRMKDQILVDIARDGELLFVEGRHRLSMAKILDLDRVPVAVCVRHEKWMEYRDRAYRGDESVTHPDFGEWTDDYADERPRHQTRA